MLKIDRLIAVPNGEIDDVLALPHVLRERSRQLVRLDSGRGAGLFLPRGTVLRDGDTLLAEDGTRILVKATDEPLSEAVFPDALAMARACFHLGNRHVPLEIAEDRVRYIHDPVVDDMLRAMGFQVDALMAPFHPEAGAYHMPEIRLGCEPKPVEERQ
ncbi:MAG: urease accessory protein UreE [Pseudodesulfovibrio sp.]|uniref:urease accessory protein UreE n=1 Tax=Pseudodesulfovibrio sp. TaxID=2035812 RepID=UPI003D1081FF